jgi:hypothetical protein
MSLSRRLGLRGVSRLRRTRYAVRESNVPLVGLLGGVAGVAVRVLSGDTPTARVASFAVMMSVAMLVVFPRDQRNRRGFIAAGVEVIVGTSICVFLDRLAS